MAFICVILNMAKTAGSLGMTNGTPLGMAPRVGLPVAVMPRGKTLSGKRCIPNRNATGVRRMNMTVISSGLNWISISKI